VPFDFLEPGVLEDAELSLQLAETIPADTNKGYVPVYHFKMMVDNKEAGSIRLRAQTDSQVELYAGHIGYGVDEAFRGHHYAERACRLLLPLARDHGITELWITCNPDNGASRTTCERLGAVLVELINLPESHELFARGERQKCRYLLELPSPPPG
jgi:predicted acetyltransferase